MLIFVAGPHYFFCLYIFIVCLTLRCKAENFQAEFVESKNGMCIFHNRTLVQRIPTDLQYPCVQATCLLVNGKYAVFQHTCTEQEAPEGGNCTEKPGEQDVFPWCCPKYECT
uniref:Single domain-containing protein n=1 Tax=Amblyomma maculatum TaxID=34609 RepID=G3MSJ5_AMBMU